MKKMLSYLAPYKKECVIAPLFKMLEAIFDLMVPLVIAAIIDKGIANADLGYVYKMFFLLVGLGLVGISCAVTAQYFSARAAVGFATDVRHALFGHLQSLSYTEIDTLGTSTMITRMTSDVNQAQSGVNMTLRLFLRSPFIVFGAMIMAFTIDFQAALVFVAAIAALGIVVFGIMKISVPLMKKVQQGLDGILGITRENLTGVRVIRAFGQEAYETKRFEERNSLLTSFQMTAGGVSVLMNPLTYILVNGAVIWLLWTGALRVDSGSLSQGQLVALYNYMSQILVELIKFANLLVTINKALACTNRIASIFEIESSMKEGTVVSFRGEDGQTVNGQTAGGQTTDGQITDCQTAAGHPAVSFQKVGLTYKGSGASSLEGIDFEAMAGSVTGIIGGTGSGKSSLVNLIPRFYDATEGQISIFGVPIKELKYDLLRKSVAVVPQKAVLFKGTIRDNLKFGNDSLTDEELLEACKIAQALDVVEKKGGLDGEIEQGGRNLSGGQRQRLTIARALAVKPRILILDDSASALDYATDAALREALKRIPNKPAVFIVSQRASSIRHADQIIVLDDGMMAGKGTHDSLLKDCEVYQEIYYSQYEKEVEA